MKQKLGKVSISPKGEWNNATTYECLDTVNFGGGSWLAKRANTAVSPVEGDDWMQLSAKGADAEVTKDSIVEALGYEPEKVEGKYELIYSVTAEEELATVVAEKDMNGNAFELSHGFIVVTCPSTVTTSRNGGIYWQGNDDGVYMVMSLYTKLLTGHTGKVYFWIHNFGSRVAALYEELNDENGKAVNHSVLVKPYTKPHITKARVYVSNNIPVGTTIEIYGVRIT